MLKQYIFVLTNASMLTRDMIIESVEHINIWDVMLAETKIVDGEVTGKKLQDRGNETDDDGLGSNDSRSMLTKLTAEMIENEKAEKEEKDNRLQNQHANGPRAVSPSNGHQPVSDLNKKTRKQPMIRTAAWGWRQIPIFKTRNTENDPMIPTAT